MTMASASGAAGVNDRVPAGFNGTRSPADQQAGPPPGSAESGVPLMLVDGRLLLYRAPFGFPRRVTAAGGEDLTGLFGFVALLCKAHREHCPEHEVFVVFDAEDGVAGCAESVPGYKPARSGADHSPVVHPPAVNQALAAAVVDRFGVRPVRWPDFRALTEDASDGIPGVAGVGPVTAGQLLARGRRLENLPETTSGRAGTGPARARAQWQEVWAWREAIRLNAHVPIPDELLANRATPELLPAGRLLTEAGLW